MSEQLTLALSIKTKMESAVKDIKTLEKGLQQNSKATQQLNKTSHEAGNALDSLGGKALQANQNLGKTRAGVQSISRQLALMQKMFVSWQGFSLFGQGVGDLAQTADTFNSIHAKLRLISQSGEEAKATFASLMGIANQTGKSFEATAELYNRVFRALGEKANSQALLNFTRTIQQALTISGTSASEAENALIQLSQGLSAGALRGEEFNSVSEQAPIILELLQKSLGKTRGELRGLAEQGKLTTDVVLKAVQDGSRDIATQFEQMPITISQSVQTLSNAWLQFVGSADQATGSSQLIAKGITALSQHLDTVARLAVFAAGALGVRYVSGILKASGVSQAFTTLSNAIKTTLNAQTTATKQATAANLANAKSIQAQSMAEKTAQALRRGASRGLALGRGIGAGVMALAGGPVGLAVTALSGLSLVYMDLKAREEALNAQHQAQLTTLDEMIAKTQTLTQARLEEASLKERVGQQRANESELSKLNGELQALEKRKALLEELENSRLQSGSLSFGASQTEISELERKISDLKPKVDALSAANSHLAQITEQQLASAFAEAVARGGELAEKLKAINNPTAPEAIALLTAEIQHNEKALNTLNQDLDTLTDKLQKDLKAATYDVNSELLRMQQAFTQNAKAAGLNTEAIDAYNAKIEKTVALNKQLESTKKAKENQSYLESLEKQAQQTLSQSEQIRAENRKRGLTGDDLARADEFADQIGKKNPIAVAQPRKTANDKANVDLTIQHLKLTGQTAKAELMDLNSRYNQLLAEFAQKGNKEGISLIKKILPLEETKIQVQQVQEEINRIYTNQAQAEQRIQAQVDTGIISHLQGQQMLRDVYAQTVAEIEKQVPLLEKIATMPNAQGTAAITLLEQMKTKIVELKGVSDELSNAFKNGLTNGIQSSLMGLAQGTMSLGDAVKNLALNVVNAMVQIATQQLAMQAVSGLGGLFGGSIGGFLGFAQGGVVHASTGGFIRGAGTSTSDSIPARLSDGEFVVKARAVKRYGVAFLHALNREQLQAFANGGLVSTPPLPTRSLPTLSEKAIKDNSSPVVSPVNIQQTLALDSAELFTAGINTVAGERAVLTLIRANKETLKQELK